MRAGLQDLHGCWRRGALTRCRSYEWRGMWQDSRIHSGIHMIRPSHGWKGRRVEGMRRSLGLMIWGSRYWCAKKGSCTLGG